MNKYILWVNYSFQLMMRHNHINALPVRNPVIFLHELHTPPPPPRIKQKTNKPQKKCLPPPPTPPPPKKTQNKTKTKTKTNDLPQKENE